MNQLFRLKENIVQFLSPPSKRQRTLPATPIKAGEHAYLTPQSHPDLPVMNAQVAVLARIQHTYMTPTDSVNPRKRRREDDNEEDDVEVKAVRSPVSPFDSISNIDVKQESISASSSESGDEYVEETIEQDLKTGLPTEQDTADDKVTEYLARQAELAIRLGDIDKVRAEAALHPDAFFLFERIAMRNFEEILPTIYKRDFPTLPDHIFTDVVENQFVCHVNQRDSSLGSKWSLVYHLSPSNVSQVSEHFSPFSLSVIGFQLIWSPVQALSEL